MTRNREPERSRRFHVGPLPDGQRLRPHHPSVGRPVAQPHHQDEVPDARSEDADHRDGQEDEREGQLHVGQAHDGVIREATPNAGQESERRAGEARQEHRRESDDARRPGAVDQPAQDVAAKLVGAQDGEGAVGASCEGGRESCEEALLVGIGGCQHVRECRAHSYHDEDRRAEARAARCPQRPHGARPALRQGGSSGREGHRRRRSGY